MTKTKRKRSPARVVLRILLALLALIVLAALVMWLIPVTERDDGAVVDGSADWMAQVDGDLTLSELAIPGTHDSATKYVQLGFFSKCQTKDIRAQLDAGYRYLDIRLGADGDRLKLMHGFTSCKTGMMPWSSSLYLDQVLEQCYAFLREHPTETVLFAVKQEHGSERVGDFQALLGSYIARDRDMWLLTSDMPTLDDARGKLVLLRRYADEGSFGSESGLPLIWADQGGHDNFALNTVASDNGSYTLWVQDRFEYDAAHKWTAFLGGLRTAPGTSEECYLNFLSTKGTAAYGHPYAFAKALNPQLMDLPLTQGAGWIIVDFATAPIAEHIYSANLGSHTDEDAIPLDLVVNFERRVTDNGREYAVINAAREDGTQVWTVETPAYEASQFDRVQEIGVLGSFYAYVEDGAVIALNLRDGSVLWRNTDFHGSLGGWTTDAAAEPTLYLCGYDGPDLCAISAKGETLLYIGSLRDDLFWPYEIRMNDNGNLVITFEGGYDSAGGTLEVNPADGTVLNNHAAP